MGNLVSQTGRGLGNVFCGISYLFAGTGQTVLSVLQKAGGGHKAAKSTFSKAKRNLLYGANGILRGVAQVCTSWILIAPVLRGAQLVSEPIGINGFYAPGGRDRTWVQNLLGLNSWDGEERTRSPSVTPRETDKEALPKSIKIKVESEKVLCDPVEIRQNEIRQKSKFSKVCRGSELEGLVAAYRVATSSHTRTSSPSRILTKIAIKYPRFYRLQQNRAWRKKSH